MNTLQHLLAQAFHDNHPGQVPEDPCPTCVQQADVTLDVLRDHSGLLEDIHGYKSSSLSNRATVTDVPGLHDLIARAHFASMNDYDDSIEVDDNGRVRVPLEPQVVSSPGHWERYLRAADDVLTVLRHTLQQHPEQIAELGWERVVPASSSGLIDANRNALFAPTLETPE